MNRKIIGSILGGVWGISMASLHFRDALMKRFGLNVNFAFSKLGGVYENAGIFVVAFFATFFGVFIAGYMMKTRIVKTGILTIVAELLFIAGIYGLLAALIVGFRGVDLSALDVNTIRPELIKIFLFLGGYVITIVMGGSLGIFVCQHIVSKTNVVGGGLQITRNENLFDYLEFYFARRGRSFFSIIIFFWGVYWLIYNTPNVFLYVKWLFIGPWFALFHPVLWGITLLWFVVIPIGTSVFLLLPFTMLFPFLYLHWTYKIGVSAKSKIRKIVYMLLLFLALGPICTILERIGMIPINVAVGEVSSRGQKVWEILLDKYTRPVAYEKRYEYLKEEGQNSESEAILNKAIGAYFDLGIDALKGQDLQMAEKSFERALKLSNNDVS